ncbi:MAG: CPBP family intramembrane metalloprotease [Elusimicrobia bacterium]|nr:CPBP family intramembrane metalloprotease [Elusimicrobiota bacterium]
MTRKTSKALAAGLSLLFVLTAPGSEAFQAMAAVVVQQRGAAASPVSGQVGALRTAGTGSLGTTLQAPGALSLQGSLSLTPAPGVKAQAVIPGASRAAPDIAAPAQMARVSPIAAPAQTPGIAAADAPTALGGLAQGVERIETGSRQDGSAQDQRQAIDELFLGKGLLAPADVAASPLASQPSGLEPPARLGAPSLKAPAVLLSPEGTKPERSLKRTLRVGWLAAIAPIAFTFLCVTVAQALGYALHPGYQSPTPSIITPQTVAATFGMAAVLAPVSEEMVFRSGLIGGIRKLTKRVPLLGEFWIPALVSSVIFVALHELSDPLLFFTRLVHSLVLSWAYHKEGLPSSIAAHAFFNGLLTLPLVFALLPGPGPIIAGVLAAALGILYTWRSIKSLRAQRADRASGKVLPFELSSKQSLWLAGLLLLGYYLLAHNPIWFLGAMGYAWSALKRKD